MLIEEAACQGLARFRGTKESLSCSQLELLSDSDPHQIVSACREACTCLFGVQQRVVQNAN
eukprot:6363915-Pyramimonas_sp.AAC.1